MDPRCREIEAKVEAGQRLSEEDGLFLNSEAPLEWVGALANRVREERHGDTTSYIINMHLNYSNLCVADCMFCAFKRDSIEQEGAYDMTLDEMVQRVQVFAEEPDTEVHIVGGLHPDYPYEYYPRLLQTLKEHYPHVHLKAFTAVEIEYFAQLAGRSSAWVLQDLKNHGLDSMPGGGAEVLTERIFKKLYRDKTRPENWLNIHREAHQAGIRTSATMLYGHIERPEERIEHLVKLRTLQDETQGFLAYIPLRFHPENTRLVKLGIATDEDVLRMVALGRLMLDNFDNIKAYWVMSGLENTKKSQFFGANDFDGTVVDERITHMAGCDTPVGVTEDLLRQMIVDSHRTPRRRNALYELLESPSEVVV